MMIVFGVTRHVVVISLGDLSTTPTIDIEVDKRSLGLINL
jgi:hypothetical protein